MDIKILKIKPWMIKFKVDDQIYFIKDTDEIYESSKQLFRYIPFDNKGHYKTELLYTSSGSLNIYDFVTRKHGQTYKDIDLNKFCAALAWYNFGEFVGMNKEDITKHKTEHRIIICREKIDKLEKELASQRLILFILEHPEEYKENTDDSRTIL